MATLSDRCSVVTGAAGGIGSAIVREFVARGAFVHCVDRDEERLHGLEAQFGGGVLTHVADLSNRADIDRVAGTLDRATGGRIDILVNGAGISHVQAFDSSDDGLLDEIIAINFTAAFRLTRALLPALRTGPRGTIVNIASELALVGQSGYSAYSASKGALLAWSRTLAVELAEAGIRVNAVCPGPIDTAMLHQEFATMADPAQARREETGLVPLGRFGAPAEIAAVVAFLASDEAAFVSGAAWSVDGGKTAR